MIWIRRAMFFVALAAFSSSVGVAQTDMSGKWEVRLEILPEIGTGTFDSIWEVEQTGDKVSGRIMEVATGKVTEFKDGKLYKSGTLDFEIKLQIQGTPATIEVGVKVKDGTFEGLYDVVISDEHDGEDDNTDTLFTSGKLTGRRVAGSAPSKNGDKKAGKKGEAAKQNGKAKNVKTEILFDGSSLDSFRGYKKEKIGKGWKVDDDTLHFDGTRSGDIITKEQYGSFELTFDWKVSAGGNSGVMYRVTLGDSAASRSGIEYQILDNDKHKDGKKRVTSAGSLYALYPPGDAKPKTPGQWNSSKIVVDGDRVQHWLNGEKVVDVEIDSEDWKKKISKSKFAKWKKFGKSKRGHIAFQDHKDPVWFRNIQIKPMD